MKRHDLIPMTLAAIFLLSCNLGTLSGGGPAEGAESPGETEGEAAPGGLFGRSPTPTPTSIPSEPVSLREGLASLNSYVLTIDMTSSGPSPAERSHIVYEMQYSQDLDARLVHAIVEASTEEEPNQDPMETTSYRIGNDECMGSKEDWSFTRMTPAQREMVDLAQDMLDVIPLIQNPVFVGSETLNGILTNHFTFAVAGLGVKSGAEVTANKGEYWLARDGLYIVRYHLLAETSSGPQGEVMRQEVRVEMTSINQPLTIAFNDWCLKEKAKAE